MVACRCADVDLLSVKVLDVACCYYWQPVATDRNCPSSSWIVDDAKCSVQLNNVSANRGLPNCQCVHMCLVLRAPTVTLQKNNANSTVFESRDRANDKKNDFQFQNFQKIKLGMSSEKKRD